MQLVDLEAESLQVCAKIGTVDDERGLGGARASWGSSTALIQINRAMDAALPNHLRTTSSTRVPSLEQRAKCKRKANH
jgi:hypothetical protein